MAYLGPPPSQKLATPTSQYFSGNGSATAFTLNRPVNVAEDLNVFVNNVAQEPGSGKSYTATGTALTFDAAPDAGTNNVYVVYRGLAEPTTRLEHPSGQPIAATTGTFSGAVSMGANNITFSNGNGIDFSATAGSGATSSILDDYEEGALSLSLSTGTASFVSSRYTKIGNQVTVRFYVESFSDISTASAISITGLPYASSSSNQAVQGIIGRYANTISGDAYVAYVGISSSTLLLFKTANNAAYAQIQHSHLTSASAQFIVTLTYEAA